uniref:DDE_Tnp_1_7 domain-containing protein n=1 Tax=Heterorhabditis bacteriophora TaxID=37862 RepID=A0A1I7WV85_HETBA
MTLLGNTKGENQNITSSGNSEEPNMIYQDLVRDIEVVTKEDITTGYFPVDSLVPILWQDNCYYQNLCTRSIHFEGATTDKVDETYSTTQTTKKLMIKLIKLVPQSTSRASNNTININEVRRICGSGASESTMCRIPNKCLNIVQSRMKKFPQLIQGDKHKRVRWSRMFMGCDWGKVIFSDKMKFNLGRPDGRHSYWSDLAFSSVVLANLAFVSKKMNSMVYQDVLGHRLVLYIECFPITSFTFQQDNATIRASRSTKTCWRTMTWPL